MSRAVLFVGHGTRQPEGVAECAALMAALTRALSAREVMVEISYLELVRPTISEGLAACAARGATEITVAPLLLFAAGHWKKDIPGEVAAFAATHPDIHIRRSEAIGMDAEMAGLVFTRAREAGFAAGDGLVVVGRGSRDPEASMEFVELARSVAADHGITTWATAVMTGIGHTPEEALTLCASRVQRVWVVPYLLFQGRVLVELQMRVERWHEQCTGVRAAVTRHLWPATVVTEAFQLRVLTALDLPATFG